MKAEKLCSLPSPFSIDLLRAISEKLQANNLHPIKKTSRKIGNKKNEKLSSSWTMFYYEGHTVPMAGHFSCLIWRLNAGREDEEPSSSLLLAVSPCNLAGRPLVQLSQSAGSAVRAVLDSREAMKKRAESPPPLLSLLHFDLFGLGEKHFSVCNEQLQTAMKVD